MKGNKQRKTGPKEERVKVKGDWGKVHTSEREREQTLLNKIKEIVNENQSVPDVKVKKDFIQSDDFLKLSLKEQKLISEIAIWQRLQYELKFKQAWDIYLEDEALAILLLMH